MTGVHVEHVVFATVKRGVCKPARRVLLNLGRFSGWVMWHESLQVDAEILEED